MKPGAPSSQSLFTNVDWTRTKAFALGLNGIFLNLKGREALGIVRPEEADPLAAEISEKLKRWRDPATFLHSTPNERFNVVIVLEDTLRANYLSAYGYDLDTSPNKIESMKQWGIQFDWAFSQATKTRPSVPSLMTSLYPTATGVWHFSDILSDRYLTLAEILRAQGFATASFIQNGNAGPYAGLHQGFSQLHDEQIMGGTTEEIYGQRVFSWLDQHRDQNFFLYLHAIDPHGRYEPPPPFDSWYRALAGEGTAVAWDDRFESEAIENPTIEGRQRRYAGEIRHNDALLPRLLEKLRELSLTENTLLILLADHGEYMGEGGRWDHKPPGLMPVIYVPFMMVYPERFPGGQADRGSGPADRRRAHRFGACAG